MTLEIGCSNKRLHMFISRGFLINLEIDELYVVSSKTRALFSCLFRGFLMNPRNKCVEINRVFCSVQWIFFFRLLRLAYLRYLLYQICSEIQNVWCVWSQNCRHPAQGFQKVEKIIRSGLVLTFDFVAWYICNSSVF